MRRPNFPPRRGIGGAGHDMFRGGQTVRPVHECGPPADRKDEYAAARHSIFRYSAQGERQRHPSTEHEDVLLRRVFKGAERLHAPIREVWSEAQGNRSRRAERRGRRARRADSTGVHGRMLPELVQR